MRGQGLSAAAVAAFAGAATGQTYTYIGNPSASWHVASNWNPNGVPGVNPTGPAVLVEQAPVSLDPGPRPSILSLSAPAGMTINNGMTIALNAAITNMDMRGTDTLSGLMCFGLLSLNGTMGVWRGGIIDCPDVRQLGTFTIGGGGGTGPGITLRGAFRNQGTIGMVNQVLVQNGALIENAGNWELGAGVADAAGNGTGGTLRNSANLSRTGPAQVGITANFDNQGQLTIDTGELSLNGFSSTVKGTVTLANDGRLKIFQSAAAGAPPTGLGFTATGQGDVVLSTGSHTVTSVTTTNLSPASPHGLWIETGLVRLDAPLVNQGLMTFAGGRMSGTGDWINTASGEVLWGTSGSTGAVLATVLLNDGLVIMRGAPRLDGGTVSNEAAGMIDLSNGAFSQAPATQNLVVNKGLLSKGTLSGSNTIFGAPLDMIDGGRIRVEHLTLSLNLGSSWEGQTLVQVGPNADANLLLESGAHIVTAGEMQIQGAGGAFEVYGAAVLELAGGLVTNQLTAPGEFRVTGLLRCLTEEGFLNQGNLRLNAGTIDGGSMAGFVNAGAMTMPGGFLLGDIFNNGNALVTGIVALGTTAGAVCGFFNESGAEIEMRGNTGLVLRNGSTMIRNGGVVSKTGAGVGSISGGQFNNLGTVRVLTGSMNISSAVPQVQGGTLTGGTWIVYPGASLTLPGAISIIGPGAGVSGGTQECPFLSPLSEVRGRLGVNAPLSVVALLRILEAGKITIEPGGTLHAPAGVENGSPEDALSEIEMVPVISDGPGPRLTTPTLTNHARLIPGGHGGPGPFNLSGNLLMRPNGRVVVELGGPVPLDAHDQLTITGAATLDGTLEVRLIAGFVPTPGQQFDVLITTAGVTGTFTTVAQPAGMPAGLVLAPVYGGGMVRLRVVSTCYANCDGSTAAPVLNVNDFLCFLNRFAAGDPYANCDGSTSAPVLNVNDFVCYLNQFGAGCP